MTVQLFLAPKTNDPNHSDKTRQKKRNRRESIVILAGGEPIKSAYECADF